MNDKDVIFSLIMATYNRKDDVDKFILSLLDQDFDLNKVELIIIDQNGENFLAEIIRKYNKLVTIKHIRSNVLGSSINRNIGIEQAKGLIIAFPDDDCTFYHDTLSEVYKIFSERNNIATVLGQIYDKASGKKIIRNWPDSIKKITKKNFFHLYSCITVFTKTKDVFFDPELGPSTMFGAYEDADYILSLVKKNKDSFYYFPMVKVNHPQLNMSKMNLKKISNYGLGFGAFCRKNISLNVFILYIGVIVYHLALFLVSMLKLDFVKVNKRYISITSRLVGFFRFGNL
ncbi:MAG: glycosyltransferase [Methylomarinum sp.]|nr:glycosyltransferase [Methylomarinum sp.]